jgi:futalosine hydrolase
MHILLAAATTFEIQPAIEFLGEQRGQAGVETDILITGVGSLATTWSLTNRINRQRPDIIIQAGIAGCWTGIPAGEVLVVREEIQADQGVWEDGQFKTLFDLKLLDAAYLPYHNGALVNPHESLLALTSLEAVRAITVSEISTDPERMDWYRRRYDPALESMEGAALHYVCLQEKVPFLQLRSVSNEAGVRDKTKWDIKKAIARLNEELIELLKKLQSA